MFPYAFGNATPDDSWKARYDQASLNKLNKKDLTEEQVIAYINNPKYASWVGSDGKIYFERR